MKTNSSRWLATLMYCVSDVVLQIALAYLLTQIFGPMLRWVNKVDFQTTAGWFGAIYSITLAHSLAQYFIIATAVDLLADHVFPESIQLATHKRRKLLEEEARGAAKQRSGPPYDYANRGYFVNHMLFTMRWCAPIALGAVVWMPQLLIDENPPLWLIPLKVQCGLVAGDLVYYCIHISQHKSRTLYKWTDHGFHHQFIYPWASTSTWLGTVDLLLAAFAIGACSVLCTQLVFGRLSLFEYTLVLNYVHEMNCVDHSGCEFPFWSGCPFFPPLGYLFNLDKSIAFHEAHHNFNYYSFGLLGVADQLFGTAKYPPNYHHSSDGSVQNKAA